VQRPDSRLGPGTLEPKKCRNETIPGTEPISGGERHLYRLPEAGRQRRLFDGSIRKQKTAGGKIRPFAALNWSPLTLRPSKRSVTCQK